MLWECFQSALGVLEPKDSFLVRYLCKSTSAALALFAAAGRVGFREGRDNQKRVFVFLTGLVPKNDFVRLREH